MFAPANSFGMPTATAKAPQASSKPKVILLGRRAVAGRTEFNKASVRAGLAARPIVTHRECRNAIGVFNQNRIADILRVRRADLSGEVETGVKRRGCVPAGAQSLVTPPCVQCTKARPTGRFHPRGRRGHDRGEKPRVEAELLIQGNMLGTVREREQPDMRRGPGIELLHCPGQQQLPDAALLKIGTHRQRAKEADAPPIGRKVRPHQSIVDHCAECGDVSGTFATVHVVPIGPECLRLRNAEERAKGKAENSLGLRQVFLAEVDHRGLAGIRHAVRRGSILCHWIVPHPLVDRPKLAQSTSSISLAGSAEGLVGQRGRHELVEVAVEHARRCWRSRRRCAGPSPSDRAAARRSGSGGPSRCRSWRPARPRPGLRAA